MFEDIVFEVGGTLYSVSVNDTQEIISTNSYKITKTPNADAIIKGIALIRNETYVVLDSSSILGSESNGGSTTLLFVLGNSHVALQVDKVKGLHKFEGESIQKVPNIYNSNLVEQVLKLKNKDSSELELVLKLNISDIISNYANVDNTLMEV